MQNHVTSLELSKTLRELGFPQVSKFHWAEFHNMSSPEATRKLLLSEILFCSETQEYKEKSYLKDLKFYSAYLATELGEWLPFEIEGYLYSMNNCADGSWHTFYEKNSIGCISKDNHIQDQGADFMFDAMAKMLIYLAEQKIIDPKNL